jgi:AcrR family transcriptional regulator
MTAWSFIANYAVSDRLSPPRWQRRADARPRELLEAALALFVERGYAATRLEEVAQRAGVAKATLYLYYANKLELFKAVVRNSLVAGLDEMATTLSCETVSAREQLVRLLTAFVHRVGGSSLSGIPKLVIAEAGNFPEMARFYYDEVIERGRAMVMGTLARGAASGEFRQVDADYAWRIVIAPLLVSIVWKHSFQAFEPEPLDFGRHLDSQLDLLFNGLLIERQEMDRR